MVIIRKMEAGDISEVLRMMDAFYASPAVITDTPHSVLAQDVQDCIGADPMVDGYVFEDGAVLAGYAMVSQGYATDCGGRSIWLEDLYLKPEYRNLGLGGRFLDFMENRYTAVRYRLELEEDNLRARHVYEKKGYRQLRYIQMTKDPYNH